MKYGLLLNHTYNIGDDLRPVASARFLPQIDDYMFKEQLDSFENKKRKADKN